MGPVLAIDSEVGIENKRRLGEEIVVADVVQMAMRVDDVFDVRGREAALRERAEQAVALGRIARVYEDVRAATNERDRASVA